MKRLLISFLTVMLMLCSCAKIDDITVRTGFQENAEIVFKPGSHRNVATKSIVEGTTMVDHFGAYGYVFPGTYTTDGGYLMKNAEYDENGNVADGGHYYWPKSDNNTTIDVLFTAYSQFDSNTVFNADSTITVSVPALTQALVDDPSNFDDVLWAQTLTHRHQSASADSTHYRVNLNFKHALSWLQFRAEVANNASIKWVKIDTVKFGAWEDAQAYVPAVPGTPYQPAVPAQYDTTDTWFNLRRSSNVDGSPTRTATKTGDTWGAYVDNFEIPAALVAEIKSYYSINNGTAGDYDLHMGNSVWPSAEIRQLRIVKDVPAAYRMPVETASGDIVVFFNALKYLEDNGYKMTYRISGGKIDVFNYPIIDLFVNGTAYTIVGLNFGVGSVYDATVAGNIPALEYTIELVQEAQPEVPEVPGTPEVPARPAHIKVDSLAIAGTLSLPTHKLVDSPVLTNADKVAADFNFVSSQVDTLHGTSYDGDHAKLLSSSLVLPQAVPEYVTLIYTICVKNTNGDDVIISGRRITRVINTLKDMDNHDYVTSWNSNHKYIYNFKINVEGVDFNVSIDDWDPTEHAYHIWEY